MPAYLPKISQGITTVIVGNCGISAAGATLKGDVPDPMNLLGEADQFIYPTMDHYARAVSDARPAVNVGTLVGHTALRNNHMDDLFRPARDNEIAAMRRDLRETLRQGALGLSTGLAYATAFASSTEEVMALAEELTDAGGLYIPPTFAPNSRRFWTPWMKPFALAVMAGCRCLFPTIRGTAGTSAGGDTPSAGGRQPIRLQSLGGALPSVTEAYVYPLRRGYGTVDGVIVTHNDLPSRETIKSVQSYIDEMRPVTAKDCLVLAPEVVKTDITAQVSLSNLTLDVAHKQITTALSDYNAPARKTGDGRGKG